MFLRRLLNVVNGVRPAIDSFAFCKGIVDQSHCHRIFGAEIHAPTDFTMKVFDAGFAGPLIELATQKFARIVTVSVFEGVATFFAYVGDSLTRSYRGIVLA